MAAARPPIRVLVVDDEPDVAEPLAMLLSLEDPRFATELARDGAAALRRVTAMRPAAVIMDIEMPVMNGFDAAAAMRRAFGDDAPMLIAVSGNREHVATAARGTLFDHAFVKPVDMSRLMAVLPVA